MKLNELPQQQVAPATIIPGSVWQHKRRDPWPDVEDRVQAKIIDAKDGWVRFSLCASMRDEREEEASFRNRFEPTGLYATGDLLKVPVPRDELEAAINDLLCAFHYYNGQTNYAVRDAAIRRAQLAIGAKVTL